MTLLSLALYAFILWATIAWLYGFALRPLLRQQLIYVMTSTPEALRRLGSVDEDTIHYIESCLSPFSDFINHVGWTFPESTDTADAQRVANLIQRFALGDSKEKMAIARLVFPLLASIFINYPSSILAIPLQMIREALKPKERSFSDYLEVFLFPYFVNMKNA